MSNKLTTENEKTADKLQKEYHWIEAAIIYENLIKDYQDNEKETLTAETSEKIAYSYFRGATGEKDLERMKNYMEKSISFYEDASEQYLKLEKIASSYFCNAYSFYVKGLISEQKDDAKSNYNRSNEFFQKSTKIFLENKEIQKAAKSLLKEVESNQKLFLFLTYENQSSKDLKQKILAIEDKLAEAWKYGKEIADNAILANSIFLKSWLIFYCLFIESITSDEIFKKKFKDFHQKTNELLKLVNDIENPRIKAKIYQSAAFSTLLHANFFIQKKRPYDDQIEKGVNLYDNALKEAERLDDILFSHKIYTFKLVGLVLSDKLVELQKVIFENEKNQKEKISYFQYFNNPLAHLDLLFLGYYSFLIGKQNFFTDEKRLENFKNAYELLKKSKESLTFFPLKSLTFQLQARIYRFLILKGQNKSDQQDYILELLENIDKSELIINNLNYGYSNLAHYLTVYHTYQTLSALAEDMEDKYKMYNISIDYLERAVNLRISPKVTQFDLEILLAFQYKKYADNFEENISKSIEILRNLSKNNLENNFFVYGAFSKYFLGRYEDQCKNFTESKEYYRESSEAFAKLNEEVNKKRLKEKIMEFSKYSKSWEILENFKDHYIQNNFKASEKELARASEIIRGLKTYNIESIYYSAWIILEKAESSSLNNKFSSAISSFQLAQESFKNSYKTYEKILSNSDFELKKYQKLSKIRRRYCKIRINIEEIRQFESNKQYTQALDKYELVLEEIKKLCEMISNTKDKKSYKQIYYVIEAWRNLLLAENIRKSDKFSEASKSFKKCCIDNEESIINYILMANSSFYKALSYIFEINLKNEDSINEDLIEKGNALLSKAKAGYMKANRKGDGVWTEAIIKYVDGIFKLLMYQKRKEEGKESEIAIEDISNSLTESSKIFASNEFSSMSEKINKTIEKIKEQKVFSKELFYLIKGTPIARSVELIKTPLSVKETGLNFRISLIKRFLTEETQKEEIYDKIKKYNLVYHDYLKKYNQFQWRESVIAIVQTSIDNKLEDLEDFYTVKNNTFRLKKELIPQIKEKISEYTKKAYQKRAKIIIFPCFLIDLNHNEFLEHIISLSKKYKMMIIPGSYHSQDTKRIITPVISPEGILWQQIKQVKSLLDLKGDKFSQNVIINSPQPEIHIGNTEIGRIVVIDCQDFLDTDLRKELIEFEPKIDIIINISFSSYIDDFKTAHIKFHKKYPIYSFFVNSSNFGESFGFTPNSNEMEYLIEREKESIIFLETDLSILRRREK